MPSARIAHLRTVNRVREMMAQDHSSRPVSVYDDDQPETARRVQKHTFLRQTYVGWSATSSALGEMIEYIEELVSFVKLLMGTNHFDYGFLSRPIDTSTDDTMSEEDTAEVDYRRKLSAAETVSHRRFTLVNFPLFASPQLGGTFSDEHQLTHMLTRMESQNEANLDESGLPLALQRVIENHHTTHFRQSISLTKASRTSTHTHI
jgi:hypothetical protein